MSYLNSLRLVFSGDFQADTSTVNNDVRHYNNANFQPNFQELFEDYNDSQKTVYNGYFNPEGSGAFRLLNCKVQAVYQDTSEPNKPTDNDPTVGLFIKGSNNRVGAKLVDLDPQWQFSSEIWGLTIRLTDSKGNDLLVGQFEPAAFRDMWFSRQQNGDQLDQTASAAFQSVLTNLQWAEDLSKYPFLENLKQAIAENKLSIRLNTFAYKRNPDLRRFSLGRVIGVIGPYLQNEPHYFVLGRRMVPKTKDLGAPFPARDPSNNINFFDCQVDKDKGLVFADLGNALPFKIDNEDKSNESINLDLGTNNDLGTLQLAMLLPQNGKYPEVCGEKDRTKCSLVTENQNFIAIGGEIPYKQTKPQGDSEPILSWLELTGGIWCAKIPSEYKSQVLNQPLALIQLNQDKVTGNVLIRESKKGLLVRAENFVQRAEPGEPINVTLFAAQYGRPFTGKVQISLDEERKVYLGPGEAQLSEIPSINYPPDALSLPLSLETDGNNNGQAVLKIGTKDPKNPREYVEGQVYWIDYQLDGQNKAQQHSFDRIFLLLFNSYQVPEQPTWYEHIQPIFQQYANLYPIMSKRLFDLSDYEAVKQHRAMLEVAFSLDPSDPNYMPVSRDLSPKKRETILKWFRQGVAEGRKLPSVKPPSEPISEPQPNRNISAKTQSFKYFK